MTNAYPFGKSGNIEIFQTARDEYLAAVINHAGSFLFGAALKYSPGGAPKAEHYGPVATDVRAKGDGLSAAQLLAAAGYKLVLPIELGPCTICFQGEMGFNYKAIKCRRAVVRLRKYAQFGAAVEIRFVEKGKRSEVGFVQTEPNLVVLEGHVDLDIPSMWGETRKSENNVEITHGRASSFSSSWDDDFADALSRSRARVLCDYRKHNAHSGVAK